MSPDRSHSEGAHTEAARSETARSAAARSATADSATADSEAARRGEASGQHQPLRRDDNDKRAKQRLGEVGLSDQGDAFEDEQRDRHSRGAPPDDANA